VRPVASAEVKLQDGEAPEPAVRALTERLADAIRAQIVEAEDHHTLELLATLERAWRHERGEPGRAEAAASLAWRRNVMHAARALAERAPGRVAAFRRQLEGYAERLRESGLRDGQLGQRYTARMVTRYALSNALNLAVMLPLALALVLAGYLPLAVWLRRRAPALAAGGRSRPRP